MNEFIIALKNGNHKAQKLLYDTHLNYLYHICHKYLKDKMLCEDVLSLVFLNIFRNIDKTNIQTEAILKIWMKKICINEALMEIRKRKWVDDVVDIDNYDGVSPLMTDSDLNNSDLIKMVMSLPNGYRTVFCLYVIDGYNHAEIAKQLGISEGTSKSQLYKARTCLQQIIKQNEVGYETIR